MFLIEISGQLNVSNSLSTARIFLVYIQIFSATSTKLSQIRSDSPSLEYIGPNVVIYRIKLQKLLA